LIVPSPSGCRSSTFSWLTEFSRSGRRPAEDLSIKLSLLRAVAQLVLPGKRRDKDVVAQGGASQAGARGKTRGTGCRSECAVGSGDLFDQSSVQLLRSRLGEASSDFLRPLGGDDGLSTELYSRPPRVRLCGGRSSLEHGCANITPKPHHKQSSWHHRGYPWHQVRVDLDLSKLRGLTSR